MVFRSYLLLFLSVFFKKTLKTLKNRNIFRQLLTVFSSVLSYIYRTVLLRMPTLAHRACSVLLLIFESPYFVYYNLFTGIGFFFYRVLQYSFLEYVIFNSIYVLAYILEHLHNPLLKGIIWSLLLLRISTNLVLGVYRYWYRVYTMGVDDVEALASHDRKISQIVPPLPRANGPFWGNMNNWQKASVFIALAGLGVTGWTAYNSSQVPAVPLSTAKKIKLSLLNEDSRVRGLNDAETRRDHQEMLWEKNKNLYPKPLDEKRLIAERHQAEIERVHRSANIRDQAINLNPSHDLKRTPDYNNNQEPKE
jgi:hypothetical protein